MKLSLAFLAALFGVFTPTNALPSIPIRPDGTDRHDDMQPLILGGTEVPIGQKTYTCGLRETADGKNFCGGSLITGKHVLTAAHCAERPINFVSVGSHFVNGASDGQQIAVIKQTKHPNYTATTQEWDFLLLELERTVNSSIIEPVSIYDGQTTQPNDTATVMGWGVTDDASVEQPDGLLGLNVRVLSTKECKTIIPDLQDSFVCAGGVYNQGFCSGDSGGPLIVTRAGRDILIGVVSWNYGCGAHGYPDVYADVGKVGMWLVHEILGWV